MDATSKRLLILCIFLVSFLTLLLVLRQRYFDSDFSLKYKTRESAEPQDLHHFTADVSLYHFSSYEGKMTAATNFFSPDFITHFPYRLGGWVGKDYPNQFGDISLFRLYHHAKKNLYLWLIMVYGGHESKFHAAEVCYITDGWDVAYRDVRQVEIASEKFPIRYFISQKDQTIHSTAYWYLWRTPKRQISDGTLMLRLSAESNASEAQGQEALTDFMEQLINIVPVDRKDNRQARVTNNRLSAPPTTVKQTNIQDEDKEKIMNWMIKQRVPNRVVPYPQIDRRYLLLSYELNQDHPQTENDRSYRYIYSRSALYDDALALIALSMAKKYKEAEGIIEAIGRIIRKSGQLWFSYNTHDDWPSEWNHEEAIIRNGASSWMGYAITYHIRRRLLEDPKWLQNKQSKTFLKLAEKIAEAILKDQITESDDPRFGLATGGWGRHDLVFDEKQKKVIEKYKRGRINWSSIEHNLDFYFLTKNLFKLTRKRKYKIASERVKKGLLNAWNNENGQFNRGLRVEGDDEAMALDCASWGYLFAHAIGDHKKGKRLLSAMEKYKIIDPIQKVQGYRPYFKGLVYDEPSINKLIYPHKPLKDWSDIDMVWSEGSLGVAMAYLKAGQRKRAKKIIQNMLKMRVKSGGLQYATQEIPFQFSPSPSMAGTAWMAMVLYAMDDPELLNLFWD